MKTSLSDRLTRLLPELAAVLWLAVFPLLGGGYSAITRSKWLIMQALTVVTVPLCLAPALLRRRERRFPWPAMALMAAFLLWTLLSCRFGSYADTLNDSEQYAVWYGARRYEGALTLLCYGAIMLLLSLNPVRESVIAGALCASALAQLTVILLQYMGLNVLGLYPGGRSVYTNYEFQGTLGNIDLLSGWLCICGPVCAFAFLRGRRWAIAGAACCQTILLCIGTESGLLALLALLPALALCAAAVDPGCRRRAAALFSCLSLCAAVRCCLALPWKDGRFGLCAPGLPAIVLFAAGVAFGLLAAKGRFLTALPAWPRRRMPLLLLALAAAALIVIALLPIGDGALYELHEVLNGRALDSFGSERVGIWRCALGLLAEHPLFGTGPDTFWYAACDWLKAAGVTLTQRFDNPHDLYLGVAVSSGWPALALWLGCVALSLRRGRKSAAAAGVLCFLAQGLFTFSLCIISPVFYALLGVCAGDEKSPSIGERSAGPAR